MLETLKFGKGNWANKTDSTLAYSDQYGNFQAIPFDFTRATTATRVNKQGLIESVNDGIARIDYSDSTQGALLLEPQSTNLITYSEDFSNSSWTKLNGATVTADTIISPDGTLNADSFTFTTSPTDKVQKVVTVAPSVKYTVSCYIKSDSNITIKMGGATAASPINVTTEWVRHTITQTNSATTTAYPQITSNGTAGTVYIYGFQLEQQSYATSYIPTNGAIATRNQEICKNATPEINSEEGVLFIEVAALANDTTERHITLSDGTINNSVKVQWGGTPNQFYYFLKVGGIIQSDIRFLVPSALDMNKVACVWKQNDFSLWINGVEVGTDILGNTFSANVLDRLSLSEGNATSPFYGKTKNVQVFNTALTDAQLQTLTTI